MSLASHSEDAIFDADFLDRLRALFLRLRKRRQLKKKGIQNTPASGFTREFKDFRHYTPNDDYRAIDWRLYARLDRLFIRLYEEVQEFHVHIVTDTSASMAVPFEDKRRTALKLTVALSYLGLVGQHRVSVYSMGEKMDSPMPPLKGQGNIQRIIDYAKGLDFSGATHLETCFRDFAPSRQRYGIIFVISDFYGQSIEEAKAAIRHTSSWPGEIHCIQVFHQQEATPDLEGEVQLTDVENGEQRRIWLTPKDRQQYEQAYRDFTNGIEKTCRDRQIDYQPWQTDLPFEDVFLEMLSRGSAIASSNG